METLSNEFAENKGVLARKRIGALQFPIGDDVSYFHPMRSSVPFVFSYTDADETDGVCGGATARSGNARWRRVTEIRARGAKSVFHFDVQGSVAKSTHSGLPWLRYIDLKAEGRIHFWPFDGWQLPVGKSVVAEVYPATGEVCSVIVRGWISHMTPRIHPSI
jgi:hypothetical protein